MRACSRREHSIFCRHSPVGHRPDGYSTVGLEVMLCDDLFDGNVAKYRGWRAQPQELGRADGQSANYHGR